MRVAIMGLGLMGGSLGLALKNHGFHGERVAYARRASTREEALDQDVVDVVCETPKEAVEGSDIVVLCVPILTTRELVTSCEHRFAEGSLVTDVGSTKAWLAEQIPPLLGIGKNGRFIGSHPIAGSEQQGLASARSDLYDNALVVVTPRSDDDPADVERLSTFWKMVGARVRLLDPSTHDRVLARTSHLPHLVAALLVASVGREQAGLTLTDFCGSGFKDTTRIADGSASLWYDIFKTNRLSLRNEAKAFQRELQQILVWLEEEDLGSLETYLENTRSKRRTLLGHAEEPSV